MLYQAVAAVLDGWRGDLSYGEVARRSGLSVPAVSEACRGIVRPRSETLVALCEALRLGGASLCCLNRHVARHERIFICRRHRGEAQGVRAAMCADDE